MLREGRVSESQLAKSSASHQTFRDGESKVKVRDYDPLQLINPVLTFSCPQIGRRPPSVDVSKLNDSRRS
jgi:hypothetical protein